MRRLLATFLLVASAALAQTTLPPTVGPDYVWLFSNVLANDCILRNADNTAWVNVASCGSLTVQESDASPSITSTTLEFLASEFVVTDQTGGVSRVVLGTVGEAKIDAAITRDAEVGALAAAAASVTAGAGAVPKGDGTGRLDTNWLGADTPGANTVLLGNRTWAQLAFSQLTGAATDAQIPDTITLTSIGQAGDVDVTGIADGECLVYDGVTNNRLEPGACGSGGASALDELTDVDAPTPSDGDGLRVNADGDYVNVALFASGTTDLLAARMSANVNEALAGAFADSSIPYVVGGKLVTNQFFTFTGSRFIIPAGSSGSGIQIGAGLTIYRETSPANSLQYNASGGFYHRFAVAGNDLLTIGGSHAGLWDGQTDTRVVYRLGSTQTSNPWELRPDASEAPLALITPTGIADFVAFRIGGAATSGNVLRGNGTDFVSAQLNYSDLAGTVPEVNNLETAGAAGIANTEIYIGTGAGTGNYAPISGDATLTNAGVLAVVDDSHAHTGATISGLDTADVTTGVFADERISASSVAQHIEGAVSFSQPAGGDPVHHQFFTTTTIIGASCRTDAGTVTLTIYESTAPFSGTDSTVTTINCTSSGVAGTITDASIAANSYVRFVYTSESGVGATSTSLRFTQ